MIDALNYIASILAALLSIAILTWLLFWTYRNFLQPEMEASTPEAHTLTKDISRKIARLNRYECASEETLADVYQQLISLARIVTSLYQRYTQATNEAKKLAKLAKCFNEDNGKVTLTNRTRFIEGATSLTDNSLSALIGDTDALTIPAYIEKTYLTVIRAKAEQTKRANSYQTTAGQLFEEIATIQQRFGEIKAHIATMKASRYVAMIDSQLTDVSRKLLIDGEPKTVTEYMEVVR